MRFDHVLSFLPLKRFVCASVFVMRRSNIAQVIPPTRIASLRKPFACSAVMLPLATASNPTPSMDGLPATIDFANSTVIDFRAVYGDWVQRRAGWQCVVERKYDLVWRDDFRMVFLSTICVAVLSFRVFLFLLVAYYLMTSGVPNADLYCLMCCIR